MREVRADVTAERDFARRYDHEARMRELARERAQSTRTLFVRRPPRPPFERAPRLEGKRPCPMCGMRCELKRAVWHPGCVELWHYIAFPHVAIGLLVKTHGRICWSCGARGQHLLLELEHIRPLWSLSADERRQHRWWLPFNLQLLCRPCHRAKTAAETRARRDGEREAERGLARLPMELVS